MVSKRLYSRTDVNKVSCDSLRSLAGSRSSGVVSMGLDIGKSEIVATIRWGVDAFERPWKVRNTEDIGALIERCLVLQESCGGLRIGMESTGTYGEAVRRAMTAAGLDIHRVSCKSSSDYKEIFDGVPSQHDGKDAAIIAELAAYGKSVPWPYEPDGQTLQELKYHHRKLAWAREGFNRNIGRLEGLLARHWPEATKHLKITRVTLLKLLRFYRNPAALAADPDAAARLRQWGGAKLTTEKIQRLIQSAKTTRGVCPDDFESRTVHDLATEALRLRRAMQASDKALKRLMNGDEKTEKYVETVGAGTLAALLATVGDPRDYASAGAFVKALGLNLKERSSGKHIGRLSITKRGPAAARRWIYYWALRAVQRYEVLPWYEEFTRVGGRDSLAKDGRAMKALVALMRRLCRGLWSAMQREEAFSYAKLMHRHSEPRRRRRRHRRRSGKPLGNRNNKAS